MVIVFSYKGQLDSNKLREDVLARYNKIIESTVDVRLFYDNFAPYLTDNKYISITHTNMGDERLEQIAISDREVGIDIEKMDRPIKKDIAKRYFCDDEVEYIDGNNARVVEIWQKREALGKSQHIGLYMDSVMGIDGFREYEVYSGYRTTIYSKDKNIFFVALA